MRTLVVRNVVMSQDLVVTGGSDSHADMTALCAALGELLERQALLTWHVPGLRACAALVYVAGHMALGFEHARFPCASL